MFSVSFGIIAIKREGAPNVVIPPQAGWRSTPKDLSNAMRAFRKEEAQLGRRGDQVSTVDTEDFVVYRRNKREIIPLICQPRK